MKIKFLAVVISMILTCSSAFVLGAVGEVKGKIQRFRIHDMSNPVYAPPYFWFSLVDISSANGCYVFNGNVVFSADTEQMYSAVLAAYMSGKDISVTYNTDLVGSDGYCNAVFITMGD